MSTGADERYMRRAIKQSNISVDQGLVPFGAVVVDRGGKLIGEGHNEARPTLDPAAHGEVVAIRNAWRNVGDLGRLKGCTIYTSCEPCLMCTFVITQIEAARVVFAARGTDVPTYRPLLGSDLLAASVWINEQPDWAKIEVVGDFMRAEAVKVIAKFAWEGSYPKPRKPK